MSYTPLNALADLEAQRGQPRPPPLGSDQVAAVNMMRIGEGVWDLIQKSHAGRKLPATVADDVYPGGRLPKGTVMPVTQARAEAAQGVAGGVLDPARGRVELSGAGPSEAIQGAVPGMYNVTQDPDALIDLVQKQHIERQHMAGVKNPTPMAPIELQKALDAELSRRGYTGPYWEDMKKGYALTPVDLRGAAPNIDNMRYNLGLPERAPMPEEEFRPRGFFGDRAQVNTETQPGAQYFTDRYRLYEGNPEAGAMLHTDYERLLRNPDNSSVVAQMMGISDTSVRQAQGIYKGQQNPVAGARIRIEKVPPIEPSMDSEMIAEVGNLSQYDRDRLNAVAVVEGMLRDQDAVAWTYPVYMVDQSNIAQAGLPWQAVNAAIFRSPMMRQAEVAKVGTALQEPVPAALKAKVGWGETWEDYIAVTEPADGSGGVMMTNVAGVPHGVFQAKVRELQLKFQDWEASRGMRTEWGRADTGYIENSDFATAIDTLPDDLKAQAIDTYSRLVPYTTQIRTYHDDLRRGAQQ